MIRCMKYVFIHTRTFDNEAAKLGLTLEDVRGIENNISDGPQRWPIIPGASGLRKMRFSPGHQSSGKSGGVRVCYFLMDAASHVYLVTVFAKNERQNITAADRNAIKEFIGRIKASYK
jgi:hypothetical protein